MRTGVSYMGHHNPIHIREDLREMKALGLSDVLVAAQENDFVWFPGKLTFSAAIAHDMGLRPLAIFWGALNVFGGGRNSWHLLHHPECFQVARDGSHLAEGCYVNPVSRTRIKQMVDYIASHGYDGYFIDEPQPLHKCFCAACRAKYDEFMGGDLAVASDARQREFRARCVVDYVREIADYCKHEHRALETICCFTPMEQEVWASAAEIETLDNIGTDIYWVNETREVEEMTPIVRDLASVCHRQAKRHHEWLQCWKVKAGREDRILDQGRILIRERPDAIYVWAWKGQIGTLEACEDPGAAWARVEEVFRLARE
ncbi:MAG: hypothetical protein M1457_06315 [bacterium]|nr:hypothetical protein [bacterium]